MSDEGTGWKKVDPAAFARAMKIMAAVDQNDPVAALDALDRANAEMGIPPRKRRGAPTPPPSRSSPPAS